MPARQADESRVHVHTHDAAHVHAHAHGRVDSRGPHVEALADVRHGASHGHTHAARAAGTQGVRVSTRAERAATWLSLACAVHCLLMPIAISVMPLLGASGVTNLGPTAEAILT